MGRMLNGGGGSGSKTPFVAISKEVGGVFVGVMQEKASKGTRIGMGEKFIYNFAIQDGTLPIILKGDDGIYRDVDVKVGDKVAVFATKFLHERLTQAEVGEIVKITYMGKEKAKGGNMYHAFTVEVLDKENE